MALAVSVLVLLFFKDSPEAAGFAPIEEGAKKKQPAKETSGRLQLCPESSDTPPAISQVHTPSENSEMSALFLSQGVPFLHAVAKLPKEVFSELRLDCLLLCEGVFRSLCRF